MLRGTWGAMAAAAAASVVLVAVPLLSRAVGNQLAAAGACGDATLTWVAVAAILADAECAEAQVQWPGWYSSSSSRSKSGLSVILFAVVVVGDRGPIASLMILGTSASAFQPGFLCNPKRHERRWKILSRMRKAEKGNVVF